MKVYEVIDDGCVVLVTHELQKVGAMFVKLSKKYPEQDWYWVNEMEVK